MLLERDYFSWDRASKQLLIARTFVQDIRNRASLTTLSARNPLKVAIKTHLKRADSRAIDHLVMRAPLLAWSLMGALGLQRQSIVPMS